MNDRADFQIPPRDLLRTGFHIREVLGQRKRGAQRGNLRRSQWFREIRRS